MAGSYLIPRSMCSEIPKPKFPVSEKFLFLNSYSLTLRPRSRISSAFGPRTVTWTAIFSFLRIPKDRTVYRALPAGRWLVRTLDYVVASSGSIDRYGGRRTVYRCLTAQLLKHLGCSRQSITRFTDGNVQDELVNAQFPHGVRALVVAFRHRDFRYAVLTIATEFMV